MKSSYYTWIPALAISLALGACSDEGGGFSGVNQPGGPSGGGGAGGGGGGAGGGGTTTEPRLAQQLETGASLFDIEISGDEDRLVFVSDQNPTGQNPNASLQIFGVDIGTRSIAQITTAANSNAIALGVFDIDDTGDNVLFASTEDVTGDNPTLSQNLFISNTSGTSVTQVTRNMSATGVFNEWQLSGDGNLVVFTSDMDLLGTNATNDVQLFSINADGTGLTQITSDTTDPQGIRLAQGGTRIAYVSNDDPVGGNPDQNQELFVINVDGGDHRQLTDTVGIGEISTPEISDNGGRLVFASDRDLTGDNADGRFEVFTINGDGTGLTQVSSSDRASGVFFGDFPGNIDISGDGNYVVFGSSFDFTGENPTNDHTIYWATSDGVTIGQPLRQGTVRDTAASFQAENVNMSNDGSAILFDSFENFSFDATGSDFKIYTTARQ